ncbi:hypothetical protein LguiA_018569 [Lonicera macranthoides]
MVGLKSFLKEAVPFVAMVLLECGEVGMTTISKAAMNEGMSNFVFIVYYNTLGIIIFLPYYIFQTYRTKPPPLNLGLFFRFFLLGLFGKSLVLFAYVGIDYSSPTLAAALGNLTPIFTFLIAVAFRMENLNIRSTSTKAKSLGTIVAVSGAFVVTLYKGPAILSHMSPSSFLHQILLAQHSNWILGGLLLAIAYLFNTIWSIYMAATVKQYPHQATVVFFYVLFGTMQCTVIALIVEKNPSTWTLHPDMELVAILYSALFATVIRNTVITWCLNEKGPLYVSMFKPLGMVVAMVGGILFLGDFLYIGSVIGAIIIAAGFYTVLWGQAKEKKDDVAADDDDNDNNTTSAIQNTTTAPLLQNYNEQEQA